MYCKYCGSQIDDSIGSCGNCNKAMESKSQVPITPVMESISLPKSEVKVKSAKKIKPKRSKKVMAIGLATVACVLIVVILVNSLGGIEGIFNKIKGSPTVAWEDRPSLETLMTASPFYAPNLELPSELAKNHNENVKNKIKGMLEITDEMMASYSEMKEDIYKNMLSLFDLINEIDTVHNTTILKDSAVLKELDTLVASFELQELKYYGLKIDATGEALYDSDLAFARVVSAVTASQKITETYHLLIDYSATLSASYAEDEDSGIRKYLRKLEKAFMNRTSDEEGATLMAGVEAVSLMLLQLDSANAFLALSNLEYIEENMESVQEDVKALRDADLVDEEFVELAELMVVEYQEMQSALTLELEAYINGLNLDMSTKMDGPRFSLFEPLVAYAADDKYSYGYGYNRQMLEEDGRKFMDQERKVLEDKYKDESYWDSTVRTAKELRKAGQDTVENLDEAGYQLFRVLTGKYYTNDEADIYKDLKTRNTLGQSRKDAGQGGIDVFKKVVSGTDEVQQTVSDGWYNLGAVMEDELGLPEDTVAQLASGMGNLAAESFTQFGKGISRILDPDAKESDIAKGCLEVATSMVGGSSNIFSATKTSGKVLGKMGELLSNPKLKVEGVLNALKAIKELSLPKLGSLGYKDAVIKGTMAVLNKSKDVAGKMAGVLDETFTTQLTGIFTKNWKNNLKGLMEYVKKVGGNVDDSAIKLVDQFTNGYLDNKAIELASQPWLWNPDISDAEKEALLAKEIDKINQEIKQGIEDMEDAIDSNTSDTPTTKPSEFAWVLIDMVNYDGKASIDNTNSEGVYSASSSCSPGSYSYTWSYLGDTDTYYDPPLLNGENSGSICTYSIPPQTIQGGETVTLDFSLSFGGQNLSYFSDTAYTGADFDGWDVEPGFSSGDSISFVNESGEDSFTIHTNTTPPVYSISDTLTAIAPTGSEGDKIAIRTTYLHSAKIGTCYIYEWKKTP